MTRGPADDAHERVSGLVDQLLVDFPPKSTNPTTFLKAQFDRGLAWVHFPEGQGGLGLNPRLRTLIDEKLAAAGAPDPVPGNLIGHGMCAPTIAAWGTRAQRARYLRPLFAGDEVWCQLFSEPGAGSDFAGLSTSAVKRADKWVVNGQKVWTSRGHLARFGLLVARTDPNVVKHAGLTAFIADMHADGVEVRPLRQMTGQAEFNEVYLSDVQLTADQVLGEPGEGWRVALTTLMNERQFIGGVMPEKGSDAISALVDTWAGLPVDRRSAAIRDEVVRLWTRGQALRLTNLRANQKQQMGDPGPEASISKVMSASLNKDVYEVVLRLLGAEGMLFGRYDGTAADMQARSEHLTLAFLRSRANSIEGGTTEVMLNILGERVLGLPSDVRVDRDRPWKEVPRN